MKCLLRYFFSDNYSIFAYLKLFVSFTVAVISVTLTIILKGDNFKKYLQFLTQQGHKCQQSHILVFYRNHFNLLTLIYLEIGI